MAQTEQEKSRQLVARGALRFSTIVLILMSVPIVVIVGALGIVAFFPHKPKPTLGWSPEQCKETERRGFIVIAALSNYHQSYQTYPVSLIDLERQNGKSFDPPTVGAGTWELQFDNANNLYRLAVREPNEPTTFFFQIDRAKEGWMFVGD